MEKDQAFAGEADIDALPAGSWRWSDGAERFLYPGIGTAVPPAPWLPSDGQAAGLMTDRVLRYLDIARSPPARSPRGLGVRGSKTQNAAPKGGVLRWFHRERMGRRSFSSHSVLGRPGSDLLSRVLRRSIIGAEGFNGRVRNGIGFRALAITTRPAKNRRRSCWSHPAASSDPRRTRMGIVNENE